MKRKSVKTNIQVDNEVVKITKYCFAPEAETKMHKHKYDYIVTPITNGKLLMIDKKGNQSSSLLTASKSYFRKPWACGKGKIKKSR